MKICVINASPRGRYSTTLHTLKYLEKRFSTDEFDYVNVGTTINLVEKDVLPAVERMRAADLVVFSYPVYTFLAPSQLHRFVRALKEKEIDFKGKFVTQVTTSKHFYDVTAHNYVAENCADLNMRVIKGLSADMEDLLNEKGRNEAEKFFEYAKWCVENNVCETAEKKADVPKTEYVSSFDILPKKDGFDTVVVTDLSGNDESLKKMIEDFRNVYHYNTRVVDIGEFPFKGGCIGCFNCAADGKCVYKDKFDEFLREKIQTADAIVYAFSIVDHSMGATFKIYDDRQFCNGHRTVTEGKPFAYLVSGNLDAENNLKTVLEARAEVGHNFLAGIATNNDEVLKTAKTLEYALENSLVLPRNFYGVGGMKIFRDLIWLMRGIMHADHKFYKSHKMYDFPQKSRGKMIAMCLLGKMIRNKEIKKKIGSRMNEGMIMPYEKVIAKTEKRNEK